MIEYVGNSALYPASITIMEDGEDTDAASYAVALEQLADRTAYLLALHGGTGFEFTDATFHGATTFADGTIAGPALTSVALSTSGPIDLYAGGGTTIAGAVTFPDGAAFSGPVYFGTAGGGPVEFQDVVTIQAPVTSTFHGRIRKRTATLPEATHTISIEEADIFVMQLLSADQSYPLSDSGAEEGDTLRVTAFENESTFNGVISYGSRTWFMRNQPAGAGSPSLASLEFVFTDGGWIKNDGTVANGLIQG